MSEHAQFSAPTQPHGGRHRRDRAATGQYTADVFTGQVPVKRARKRLAPALYALTVSAPRGAK